MTTPREGFIGTAEKLKADLETLVEVFRTQSYEGVRLKYAEIETSRQFNRRVAIMFADRFQRRLKEEGLKWKVEEREVIE